MTHQPKIAIIGEVMVEFSPSSERSSRNSMDNIDTSYNLGYAGDTFNTAVGVARQGITTSYVTRLGDDPFSDGVVALMTQEDLDTKLVTRVPDRQPGMYVIANDVHGERTFRYWRGESPARELWSQNTDADKIAIAKLESALNEYSCIYLSGITLAIMLPEARSRLARFLSDYKEGGGMIAFDSNYRPRLWASEAEAKDTIGRFIALADLALLTIEDEQMLWNNTGAEDIILGHLRRGVAEVVIKQGSDPVLIGSNNGIMHIKVPPVEKVVDTTGAGDGFNAGYLAGKLRGETVEMAARRGITTAALTLGVRGGIIPRDYFFNHFKPGGA